MGMQLNIKSDEAYALASKIAEAEGISLTQAVIEALRARERKQESAITYQKALAICRDTAPRLPGTQLSIAHGDLLYDDYGLPA
jgi:antitoxin VapB